MTPPDVGYLRDESAATPPASPMDKAAAAAKIARGMDAAESAIDSARAAAAMLRRVGRGMLPIPEEIGIPALFIARRLQLMADALAAGEAEPDWNARRGIREQASYALKGAAGLVSLLQTDRDARSMFSEALIQIEQDLLDRAQDLLDVA